MQAPATGAANAAATDAAPAMMMMMKMKKSPVSYTKFTDQMELGKYLTAQYHIRRPDELSSCETCHR